MFFVEYVYYRLDIPIETLNNIYLIQKLKLRK